MDTNSLTEDMNDVPRMGNLERFTGRKIVSFGVSNPKQTMSSFKRKTGLKLAGSGDYNLNESPDFEDAFKYGSGVFFERLGVAIIGEDNDEAVNFILSSNFAEGNGMVIEPERILYAFDFDENQFDYEWGIDAINPSRKSLSTLPTKIAVLDTGIDLAHSDFQRLNIIHSSFIPNQTIQDLNGHGTHCGGVAVAGANLSSKKRYGISANGDLIVGKVLSNQGKSADDSVFAGMEWALNNNAKVISMSLGSVVKPNEEYSPAFERIASRALKGGSIVIAAAGNESMRSFGVLSPVCHPANCPSIMAIGAVGENGKIADFSCSSINQDGGKIDLVAPGVKILSSWKGNNYKSLSGTSMATPFVAGVAAKIFGNKPTSTGYEVWTKLVQTTKPLNLPAADVGAGLLQA